MAEQKRLEQLDIGDCVEEGYNSERQLLVSNFPIHDQTDLDRLEEIGVVTCSVRVNGALETEDEAGNEPESSEDSGVPPAAHPSKSSVVDQARFTYYQTLEKLDELVQQIQKTHETAEELDELKPLLNRFIAYIEVSPPSVSCLTQIQEFDDFTYHHSLNISLLCLLYGHHKGFEKNKILEFGFGGLVHDIGKTDYDRQLVRKDKLTEDERSRLRKHPRKGQGILEEAGFSDTVQNIALQHHCRPDGSGYPSMNVEMDPLARIVSVLDEYEPLLATAPNRERLHPVQAYTRLKETFYDYNETRNILKNLVKFLGLYPVGCLVQLSNNDLAVVMENTTDHLRHPLVRIVGSRESGAVSDFYDIDLDRVQYQKRAVKGKIYDESVGIKKILNYSDAPRLRKTVPPLIEENHATA